MNHLINFYKNRAEQLQEKINNLVKTLPLYEKHRGFDIESDYQNMLYPPNYYIQRNLPNPWDKMDPKTRLKELERHIPFWTTRDGTNPVGQGSITPNLPNFPHSFPSAAGRSALQSTGSNFMDEQVLYEGYAPSTANVFSQGSQDSTNSATTNYSRGGGYGPWGVGGSAGGPAGRGSGGITIPQPPTGAVPLWLARWYWLFRNWNNSSVWTNMTPGSYLAWLMGQWGNPDMNYGRKWG